MRHQARAHGAASERTGPVGERLRRTLCLHVGLCELRYANPASDQVLRGVW